MARRLDQLTVMRLACLASSSSRCQLLIVVAVVTVVIFVVIIFFDPLSAGKIPAQLLLLDGGEDIMVRGCDVDKVPL